MKTKRKDSGFTLVELSISLLVLSFLLVIGLLVVRAALDKVSEDSALGKMEKIADSISIYTQRNNRVPCPAEPALLTGATTNGEPVGAELNSGANGILEGNCRSNNDLDREGIIPFVTLGLSQEDVIDPWGNYFTYKVSATSALNSAEINNNTRISNWCRVRPLWYDEGAAMPHSNRYLDIRKAAFCCGTHENLTQPSRDIQLSGPHGLLNDINRNANNYGANQGNEYGNSNAVPPNKGRLEDTYKPRFPAYILISHGAKDYGAYSVEGSKILGSGLSAQEEENGDGDVDVFVTDRLSPFDPGTGAGNFRLFKNQIDDIVFWQTPAQVMTRVGGSTCSRP